jgi:2-methylcitrate dehydratase PrpD
MHATPAIEPRAGAPDDAPVADPAAFVRGLSRAQLPDAVVAQALRCLLDLVGVAAAGSRTRAAHILRAYAEEHLGGRDRTARMLFDGGRASLAGAALAGAGIIDAFDAHDGHPLTKGHAGVAVLPALLAFCDAAERDVGGDELVVCLVLGYEVATRAGIALHAYAADFHCSGAWNALGAAAIGSRLLRLDAARLRHALGIAEYLAPRGLILRVCGEPTMVKDGSAWGAHAGVTAALLAQEGFTGAPAAIVERGNVAGIWSDLGARWYILEQYFKPYPVCRWAQPAIEAALALQRIHGFDAEDVSAVCIESFAEAIALGSRCAQPQNTDQAQYSITYPVAAALVFGRVGADELTAVALRDPRVLRLMQAIELVEAPDLSRRFPAERHARVRIGLRDGRVLRSQDTAARGDAREPLSDAELRDKFFALADPVLGPARAARIAAAIAALNHGGTAAALVEELLASVG